MNNITDLPEWKALDAHHKIIKNERMEDFFTNDPLRFSRFSINACGIFLDYSKNRVNRETIQLLCQLARARKLPEKTAALFKGDTINATENRAVLHSALRSRSTSPLLVNGENITPLIQATLEKMRVLCDKIREGNWLGSTGKAITDIVNIGIGGSQLGPLLATEALSKFASDKLQCHFISNVDKTHVDDVLNKINPETTLFILSSKSFTTIETFTNTNTVKEWLKSKIANCDISKHFVAVTAAFDKAIAFGIPENQIFPMWNWVGGRYSIWSAIGLPLAILIGMNNFLEFHRGAYEMDQHFRQADYSANLPVLMALLGIWYINFFNASAYAVIPYAHELNELPAYLQQADMESNGKSVAVTNAAAISYNTGPILFGEQGCNSQHAFNQLLHQGNHLVPVDFILVGKKQNDAHQDILISSALSQAQALMLGKSYDTTFNELIEKGVDKDAATILAKHQTIPGNRPSNTLFINEISPYSLGALLALYEHKIFVQGVIWDINSFDQWGVELGKQLLPEILTEIQNPQAQSSLDSSTYGLIQHYKNLLEEIK